MADGIKNHVAQACVTAWKDTQEHLQRSCCNCNSSTTALCRYCSTQAIYSQGLCCYILY